MTIKIDTNELAQLNTADQIDQYVSRYVDNIDPKDYPIDPYESRIRLMSREEYYALSFLYCTWADNATDEKYLEFVKRYDETHGERVYEYYAGPTITPDVRVTTLRMVLIDALQFDRELVDYAATLQFWVDNDFVNITID